MRSLSKSVALAALALPCLAGAADDTGSHPYLNHRHAFAIGAVHHSADIEVAASVPDLIEADLSLDDLGVDDRYTSWLLEYRWRFTRRWALIATAYTFEDDGVIAAAKSFNFDGQVYEAGASIETDL